MRRLVLTVPLRRGTGAKVRKILRKGPPFRIEDTPLEHHSVFVARDELIFFFEGAHAERVVKDLLAQPGVALRASRIGPYVGGAPRIGEEVFAWERPDELDGVSFAPLPGPGDSEGGPVA
jgi:hypothetical protein